MSFVPGDGQLAQHRAMWGCGHGGASLPERGVRQLSGPVSGAGHHLGAREERGTVHPPAIHQASGQPSNLCSFDISNSFILFFSLLHLCVVHPPALH